MIHTRHRDRIPDATRRSWSHDTDAVAAAAASGGGIVFDSFASTVILIGGATAGKLNLLMICFEESFPSPDVATDDLLCEMTILHETYSQLTIDQRIRYTTLIAKWTHALRQAPTYRAQGPRAPLFGRRQMRCDCMWSELLFSAVDLGLMFLARQSDFEQDMCSNGITLEERRLIHQQTRKVIGLLYHAFTVISKGWKGLRPTFFRNLQEPIYDLGQLQALHLWVQAYGLWNRGFITLQTKDMEAEPIFRTCGRILATHEAQQLLNRECICSQPLSTGAYQPLLQVPSSRCNNKFKHVWFNFARTEWIMAAANAADAAKDVPRIVSLVRLLYMNDRPYVANRLVELERRLQELQTPVLDPMATLTWLCDRYPCLPDSASMRLGDDPLQQNPSEVFVYTAAPAVAVSK